MIVSGLKKISSFIMAVSTVSLLTLGCSGGNDNSLSVSDNLHEHSGRTYAYNWKYCIKCNCVYYLPSESTSHCAAGGTHEHEDNSYTYKLYYNCTNPTDYMQVGWRYCTQCNVLYWCQTGGTYIRQCPAGSANTGYAHTPDQRIFYLLTKPVTDFADIQDGWRYCGNCKNLFYSRGIASPACTCGPRHDGTISSQYYLPYNLPGVNWN